MANYHGPFYDKACSVFQRRVKQVSFQLNPFLERTNVRDEDADVYQPSSKFVIPTQSIVVCEHYNEDAVKDWKLLNPDQFWEYLYSDDWSKDCTLRVLEGQLLELLMMLLCIMEKEDEIMSHMTFGFSKNMRRSNKCCITNKNKKAEFVEETLLVEFVYYGIKHRAGEGEDGEDNQVTNWRDMSSKASGVTKLADLVEILSKANKANKSDGGFFSMIRPPKSHRAAVDDDKNVRIESLTAMRWKENCRIQSNRRRSSNPNTPLPPDPASSPCDRPLSNIAENGSDILAKMDDILFQRSKKVGRTKRNSAFFTGFMGKYVPPGDEFYINQLKPYNKEGISTVDFLKAKSTARATERDLEIQQVKELTDHMKNIDLSFIQDSHQTSDSSSSEEPFIKLYKRSPSFATFYKYLEEVNKFDPRYKKAIQRKKRIVDKYKSNLKEKKDSKLNIAVDKKPLKPKASGLLSIKNSTAASIGKQVSKTFSKKIVVDRQRFADEVGGVTDSEPCRRHCLNNVSSFHQEEQKPTINLRGRVISGYVALPKITSPIAETSVKSRSPGLHAKHSARTGNKSVQNKRSSYVDSDSDPESADSVYDDEEDDFEDTVFDTKKLHKTFSIEKIRAIKLKKEKKPPVINILRKFCRVNRMMNAMGPGQTPSKSSRKSVVDAHKSKQANKAFGMFRRMNQQAAAEVKPAANIGKLKTFGFLKHKDHKVNIPDVELPNFDTSSIEAFKIRLLKAFDDFIIRKERTTTSHTYETLATITFTKPETYVRLHQIPQDASIQI